MDRVSFSEDLEATVPAKRLKCDQPTVSNRTSKAPASANDDDNNDGMMCDIIEAGKFKLHHFSDDGYCYVGYVGFLIFVYFFIVLLHVDDWDSEDEEDEDCNDKSKSNEVGSIRDLLCKSIEEGEDYYGATEYDDY